MVFYLDQPIVEALKLPENLREVEQLLVLYDKYSFENGLHICDAVLTKFFKELTGQKKCSEAIHVYTVAYNYNLPKTKERCRSVFAKYFKDTVGTVFPPKPRGYSWDAKRAMDMLVGLGEDGFKSLVPMIVIEDDLFLAVNSILSSPLSPETRDTLEEDHCFPKLVLTSILWRNPGYLK